MLPPGGRLGGARRPGNAAPASVRQGGDGQALHPGDELRGAGEADRERKEVAPEKLIDEKAFYKIKHNH